MIHYQYQKLSYRRERNSASAAHVYLCWLTDRAFVLCTEHHSRRCCRLQL